MVCADFILFLFIIWMLKLPPTSNVLLCVCTYLTVNTRKWLDCWYALSFRMASDFYKLSFATNSRNFKCDHLFRLYPSVGSLVGLPVSEWRIKWHQFQTFKPGWSPGQILRFSQNHTPKLFKEKRDGCRIVFILYLHCLNLNVNEVLHGSCKSYHFHIPWLKIIK